MFLSYSILFLPPPVTFLSRKDCTYIFVVFHNEHVEVMNRSHRAITDTRRRMDAEFADLKYLSAIRKRSNVSVLKRDSTDFLIF